MRTETVVSRGSLSVSTSNDIFTAPDADRELLAAVLKIASKVEQPAQAAFADLGEHLTASSSAAEILLALKFVRKTEKPVAPAKPTAAAPVTV